jgi:hypothetical protein
MPYDYGELLNWRLKKTNEWINHWLCKRSASLHEVPIGEHGGGFFTGHLRESEILLYQTFYISGLRMLYERRLWKRTSLSIGTPLGKLEGGFFYRGLFETVKEGSGNGASVAVLGLCEGNLEGGLPRWRPWRLYEERFWLSGISLYRGHIGEPGGEILLPGT